jgi:hypothetical protein
MLIEEQKDDVLQTPDKNDVDDALQTPVENGGSTDLYIWTQTAYDLTFTIDVCKLKNISSFKAKNIKVVFDVHFLKIFFDDGLLIQGDFLHAIKVETSTWYKNENQIVLEVDKFKKQEWWDCFFKGDKKIDASKITPATEYIGDLDQETRMTIDKMMKEQEAKEKAGFYDHIKK